MGYMPIVRSEGLLYMQGGGGVRVANLHFKIKKEKKNALVKF